MVLKNELQIDYLHPDQLKVYHRQLRAPSKRQVQKTVRLIEDSGMLPPVVIDKENTIIIGLHFVEAARNLKLDSIPIIKADHLTDEQVRTLRIAYDRIAEEAEWNKEELALEFQELKILIPDITITGFDQEEIDLTLDILSDADPDDYYEEAYDNVPLVTKPGDVWQIGTHLLRCGDSLQPFSYEALMRDETADAIFTDPPYNVPIDGHVCGSGKIKHDEFAMAAGEMSDDEFGGFLGESTKLMAEHSKDGSLHYICMDWRGINILLNAAKEHYSELKNICVWNKDNAGMGSLYRSKHEFIAVFKNGTAKHTNNVELGKNGRYRTNVWDYPGVSSIKSKDDLKMHPTVKPVAMIADAIKDCTKRGQIILDPFAGSGSTLIACEKSGRLARCIELEPKYCDVIIRRWQELTGLDAVHVEIGKTFNEISEQGGSNNE